MDALAGGASVGKVPEGAGALYGAQRAAAGIEQKQAAQKQQQFENQQKTQQMSREEAIARATIAHENAATLYQQQLSSTLESDNRQKNVVSGTAGLQPYIAAGAPIIQQGIDSDEVQTLLGQRKLDPTQMHIFATGEQPILGADGKQEFDKAGNPLTRPTYTVVDDVPQIALDAKNAELISANTPYKLPEGTKMSGLVYGTLIKQAQAAETATMAIDEARAKAGLDALDVQQKTSQIRMLPDWNAALAKAGGDPFKALNYMTTNPQMKQKYPDAQMNVQALYGGSKEWETMRHDREDEAQKAETLRQGEQKIQLEKETGPNAAWGDPNAATPEAFRSSLSPAQQSAVDMIGQGRAPINRPDYILARNPGFIEAVGKLYPQVDLSNIGAYQRAYKSFTSGKEAAAVNAGATALEHLNELRQLNTPASMVPGTPAYTAYKNKANTLVGELMNFYKISSTEANESDLKSGLDAMTTWNRNAAILTQAKSMGDKLDNYKAQWDAAAPSPQYEAQYPGISDTQKAQAARAQIDPDFQPAHKIPPRPPRVPSNAIWNPGANQWQLPQ